MPLCVSVYLYLVVTSWERADLLALVCGRNTLFIIAKQNLYTSLERTKIDRSLVNEDRINTQVI